MPPNDSEDAAAEEHVVEVRDDEVAVVLLGVDRGEACMTPEMPPMVNWETSPIANSIGVENFSEPLYIVPIQLKIFTPVGIAISIVLPEKMAFAVGPSPVVNMWWTQTLKPRTAIAAIA